jgi:hypothetical protein
MRDIRKTHALLVALLAAAAATVALVGTGDAGKNKAGPVRLFQTSDQCMACHNGLAGPAGEDVSIGTDWRATMMANSSRDPYWQAGIRRETLDHPSAREAIEAECSICHMPMARFTAHTAGREGEVFTHLPISQAASAMDLLAADGVSCTVCHQVGPENLGQESSFVGGMVFDTDKAWGERIIYGPYEVDEGRTRIMSSGSEFVPSSGGHMQDSAMCATCHTLYTASLGPDGKVVGELPEQVPYLEWLHSRYPGSNSCQSCHMVEMSDDVPITSVWGEPRTAMSQHVFRGGNFFIPRLLNKYRKTLGTAALPLELGAAAERTLDHLETSAARIAISGASIKDGRLEATVQVENLAGHKLPSAYPSRRVWIRLTVSDAEGKIVFASGVLRPDGSIEGNDNDADPTRHEPHHSLIDDPDKVQIYEAILGAPGGSVTTGLLTATHYLKDNRLLPEGFDKASADEDVAVHGPAAQDADFTAGADRVQLSIPLAGQGPCRIVAELLYQPIGFRWAMNLADYDAEEPQRFVSFFTGAAHASSAVLASDAAVVAVPPPATQ